jgi:hypothetical protein
MAKTPGFPALSHIHTSVAHQLLQEGPNDRADAGAVDQASSLPHQQSR